MKPIRPGGETADRLDPQLKGTMAEEGPYRGLDIRA